MDNLPPIDYAQLLEEEKHSSGKAERPAGDRLQRPALKQLLTNLLSYGFTFVDGTPTSFDATMEATSVISFPQVGIANTKHSVHLVVVVKISQGSVVTSTMVGGLTIHLPVANSSSVYM